MNFRIWIAFWSCTAEVPLTREGTKPTRFWIAVRERKLTNAFRTCVKMSGVKVVAHLVSFGNSFISFSFASTYHYAANMYIPKS